MKKRRASARNGPAPSQPAGDPSSSGRSEQGTRAFPIVGVGASAGGLDAFTQLLRHVPEKPGVAFVLIQHLDPNHPSLLAEAIGRITTMPVEAIREGTRVEPDHVYVTPPDADVSILHGTLTLLPRPKRRGIPHLPIDFFFRALAADQREWAVGVILSGTGADGVEGLRAIKAEDGLTFAQEPGSAAFAGMPESAVRAGVADVVLPVPELAEELLRLAREPHLGPRDEPLGGPGGDDALKKVIVLVRDSLGADLSEYKSTTLKRRLARRMALRGQRTLPDYIALLREDPKEISALHEDVLIHVTSFFRDAGAFERLKEIVFPAILKHKAPGAPIRIWVAGCSSGEEAYSIAIALFEFLGQDAAANPIQIFGTDISEKAVASARAGLYPDGIARDVSPARLKRFFTRGEHGYQVNRAIREPCVFVRHDLACDPPFSKLDLVSCRNVLIYFNPALQRRLSDTFHFALNRSGFLLLGRSENLVDPDHLFSIADKEQKILARVAVPSTLRLPPRRQLRPRAAQPVQAEALPSTPRDLGEQLEGLLLKRYAPPGVLINERMEILHFRGRTGPYLEPAPGQPQLNLLKMAREGLLADLRIAIAQARKERATVRRSGVQVKQDDSTKTCAIVVVPLAAPPDARDRLFAVLFEDAPPTSEPVSEAGSGRKSRRPRQDEARYAARMEEELRATKEYLQSLVEDHQRANDELLSANEELVSSNEELQSLNEELETAKEELQSTNEELTTLNDEMRSRNTELNLVNSDLLNVLGSVEIPIVIVDGERRIRRFTPRARPLLNLVPADVGRPLDDIKTSLRVGDFDSQIAEVIESARVSESDVQDRDGRWYRLQIRPYLTIDKKIDGAVLSIVDIDALKRALDTAEWAREYAAATVEAVQIPLVVLDEKLRVLSANEAFYQAFSTAKHETEGRSLYDLGGGRWQTPALRDALEEILEKRTRFHGLEVQIELPGIGQRSLSLSARPVPALGMAPMILLAAEDVTARKEREAERARLLGEAEEAKARADEANRTKDLFLATLSHELRTPLSTLIMNAQLLRRGDLEQAKVERATEAIERAAKTQAQLIDDLLDVSRIVTGKLRIERQPVDLAPVVQAAVDTVRSLADRKAIVFDVELGARPMSVSGDPVRLQQVVWNLLTNAIKFTPAKGRVTLRVDEVDGHARLRVTDSGVGMAPEFLPHVFDRFTQADGAQTREHGGLGLGLAIVRHLVEGHGGTVRADSPGRGHGSTFTVTLPLLPQPEKKGPAAPPPARRERSDRRGLGGLRVLLVEDDPDAREGLADLLGATGAVVEAVASAPEAMRALPTFRPQLILCDISMPGEDGYSLLRRIRALGHEGGVPAIALTAHAAHQDRERALSAGFQKHIAKPFDFDRLLEAAVEILDRGEPAPTAPLHES